MSTLYMIPCPLGEMGGDARGEPRGAGMWAVLPAPNLDVMRSLDYFIVENTRSARRFLSAAGIAVQSLEFAELNEHTSPADVETLIQPLLNGRDAGMISEAGVPGVADPGAAAAALCHSRGIRVVPLVGPSSILLALMASGLNGQSFAFNGYLPIKNPLRTTAIRNFERRAQSERQTQIFIETPYRNNRLFDELLATLRPETLLCLAVDLTLPTEFIRTLTVGQWRAVPKPALDKRPAIFMVL